MLFANGFGEHGVDVLFRTLQLTGDLQRRHAGAGQGDQFVAHIGHRFRRLDLTAEDFEEGLAVAFELARTDTADRGHFCK
ncbi:hypothetical protein D3C85_1363620 [compost metagenome]